jgi:hypothetical protein
MERRDACAIRLVHTTRICGSNGKPLYASKIKEVS